METFWDDLDLQKPHSKWYFPLDMSRRTAFTFLACLLYGRSVYQLMAFLVMSFWTLVYLYDHSPFKDNSVDRMELLNELKLYFCSVCLGFSQATSLYKLRKNEILTLNFLGWTIFWTEILFLAFNLLILIYGNVKFFKREIKVLKVRKYKSQMKKLKKLGKHPKQLKKLAAKQSKEDELRKQFELENASLLEEKDNIFEGTPRSPTSPKTG